MRHATGEHTPGTSGYDAELRRHNEVLRRAVGVQLHDHVLDIGCGTGQTTRQAARTARAGSALGVDVSAPAIKRARELARAAGLRNVTFEHADAQVHRFPQERFDLAISRFGTMFFDDPVAAFANIGRALRPAGRLVMMVWQAHERNEWDVAIHQSLEAAEGPLASASGGPDPFSLADPPTVKEILQAAGFAGVAFTDVHEPVYYGPEVAAALDWIRGFTCTSNALKRLDPAAATRAVEGLRVTLAAHRRECRSPQTVGGSYGRGWTNALPYARDSCVLRPPPSRSLTRCLSRSRTVPSDLDCSEMSAEGALGLILPATTRIVPILTPLAPPGSWSR